MNQESLFEKTCNLLLLLIICFIILFPLLSFGGVKTVSFLITHIATMILVFFWIFFSILTGKLKLIKSFYMVPVILFIVYAGIMFFQSDFKYYSRNEFLVILDYAVVFIILISSFYKKQYAYTIVLLILLVGIYQASMGVIQYFKKADIVYSLGLRQELVFANQGAGSEFIPGQEQARSMFGVVTEPKPKQYENRASGLFVCPNHFAGFLEICIPLALSICLFSRFSVGVRLFLGYGCLIMFAGWILSFSRGGWISGMVSLVVLFVAGAIRSENKGQSAWVLPFVIITISLVLLGVFVRPIQKRLLTIKPTGDQSTNTRVKIWSDSMQMIKEKPVFGYGPAAFLWHYPPFKHDGLIAKVTYTHNDYLNTLVDYGAVGLSIIILFFLYLLAQFKKIPDIFEHSDKQALLIGAFCALVAITVHAVFDFNNHIYSNGMLLILMAYLVIVNSASTDELSTTFLYLKQINRNKFVFVLVGLILLAASGWGVLASTRLLLADVKYREGTLLQKNILWNKALEKYETAKALDPINPLIYDSIAEVYSAMSLFRKDTQKETISKAIENYDIALKQNPYESDFMYKKALLLKRIGKYDDAYNLFEQALEQEPTNTAYENEIKKLKKFISKK